MMPVLPRDKFLTRSSEVGVANHLPESLLNQSNSGRQGLDVHGCVTSLACRSYLSVSVRLSAYRRLPLSLLICLSLACRSIRLCVYSFISLSVYGHPSASIYTDLCKCLPMLLQL